MEYRNGLVGDSMANKIKVDIIKSFEPIIYTSETFGFMSINETGKNVKICLIDSGAPNHASIKGCVDYANFSKSPSPEDILGHATVMSGLITANTTDRIVGLSTDAKLYFSKATCDDGNTYFNGLLASVLWGIVKNVDIIVIPVTLDNYDNPLADAVKKAHANNICVITSSISSKVMYPDTLTVIPSNISGVAYCGSGKITITMKDLISTYINQSYVKVSGGVVATAIIASICAKLIERNKNNKIKYNPTIVYGQIIQSTLNVTK